MTAGWAAQGAVIGTRSHISIFLWHRDLPGGGLASGPGNLATFIARYHRLGSRFISLESGDNWGPCGLGYYVAARVLWDVREAGRVDALCEDFLDRAFGAAREPMRDFYRQLNGDHRVPFGEDMLARMYRALDAARRATADTAVHRRLDDLAIYTRYADLYHLARWASPEARQQAWEVFAAFALRTTPRGMVSTRALHRELGRLAEGFTVPSGHDFRAGKTDNPWMRGEPFSPDEIAAIVRDGIASNTPAPFAPASFSDDLVPAPPLASATTNVGVYAVHRRYLQRFYTWVEPGQAAVDIQCDGPRLYRLRAPEGVAENPLSEVDLTAERFATNFVSRPIRLPTDRTGLHILEVGEGYGPATVRWPEGMPMAVVPDRAALWGGYDMCFYVPLGTQVVGGHIGLPGRGRLYDGAGRVAFRFSDMQGRPGHFHAAVPPGGDGSFWRLVNAGRNVTLLTVPPYLARTPGELMLPREVVEADWKDSRTGGTP